jgi:hypothetical protein
METVLNVKLDIVLKKDNVLLLLIKETQSVQKNLIEVEVNLVKNGENGVKLDSVTVLEEAKDIVVIVTDGT